MVNKKKTALFIFGCIIIALAAMLLVYGILVASGVVHLKQNKLVFSAGSADKFYDGTPLTNDSWKLESGVLQGGHRVRAVVSGEQTLPGKGVNNINVTIIDENDVDVTDEYVIECVPGTLYVKGIRLVFSSASASKEYDGTPLTAPNSVLTSGKPMTGHKIVHNAVGTITDIGSTENFVEVEVTEISTGFDVSYYYEIEYELGTLDVTKIPITLVTSGGSKFYDGTPLTNSDHYVVGALRPGHIANVEVIGTTTNVGVESNRAVISIRDMKTGNDVTGMYEITNDFGILTVVEPEPKDPPEDNTGSGTLSSQDINKNNLDELTTKFFDFTSDTTGTVLVRKEHFGNYTLSGWETARAGEDLRGIYVSGQIILGASQSKSHADINILSDSCSFLIPYYAKAYNLDTSMRDYSIDYAKYDYLKSDTVYSLTPEEEAILKEYTKYVYDNYTALGSDTKASMLSIFRREATKAGYDPDSLSGKELISWVEKYVKGAAEYNLNFEAYPEGVDTAVYFLTESKEGVCRHFATAAVAMYRALGIPARYTVGFKVSAVSGKTVTVMGDRAHAWVEVFIDGLGWITVDPTASASSQGGSGGAGGAGGEGVEGSGIGGSLGGSDLNSQLLGAAAMQTEIFSFIANHNNKILFKSAHFSDYLLDGWADSDDGIFADMKYVTSALAKNNTFTKKTVTVKPKVDVGYLSPYYQVDYSDSGLGDGSSMYSVNVYDYSVSDGQIFELGSSMAHYELIGRAAIYDKYTALPENTRTDMSALLAQIEAENGVVFANMSRLELILWIENYVKGAGEYNMAFGNYPEDADTAIYFLTKAKEGVCRHFATAATVMLRTLGVPARYTVGFSAIAVSGKEVTVKGDRAHAWVEAYIDGFGWVNIDPTGSDGNGSTGGSDNVLKVTSSSADKQYDGIPLREESLSSVVGLKEGHTIEATFTGEQIGYGSSKNKFEIKVFDSEGNDVTADYNVIREYGRLTVVKKNISISTGSAEQFYSGKPLTNKNYEVEGELAPGDIISIIVTGTITDPGSKKNDVKYKIFSSEGDECENNYDVNLDGLGVLTVKKISLAVKSESAEKMYDGEVLTCEEWVLESGNLLYGHNLSVEITGKRTEPGTERNTFNVYVTDADGTDVTDKYSITKTEGTLNVIPLPIIGTVTFTSDSIDKTYDGTPLLANGLENVKITEGELVEGHSFVIENYSEITDAGEAENVFSVKIFDESGEDVTGYYDITKNYGKLTVHPISVTIETGSIERVYDGTPLAYEHMEIVGGGLIPGHYTVTSYPISRTEAGISENEIEMRIFCDGEDVTENYSIEVVKGTINVLKRPLTIVTGSAEKLYDGTALTCDSWYFGSNSVLADGEYISVTVDGRIVERGSSENTATVSIFTLDGEETTASYEVKFELGTLTVYSSKLNIKSLSASKSFDTTPITQPVFEYTEEAIMKGHELVVDCYGSQTEIGVSENLFNYMIVDEYGNDLTAQYLDMGLEITIEYGTLEITSRAITVISDNEHKFYDGETLYGDSFRYEYEGALLPGHEVKVEFLSSITEEGECDNEIKAWISDENGVNVNGFYDLHVIFGKLTVERTPIMIKSNDDSKEYDGTPLINHGYELLAGYFRESTHIPHFTFDDLALTKGTYNNSFDLVILDENGKDITMSYNIIKEFGELEITPYILNAYSMSDVKEYDRSPLTNGHAWLDRDVVAGHSYEFNVTGSQTEIGVSENTFDIVILDEYGEDIGYCYQVNKEEGALEVTKIKITVSSFGAVQEYNGLPLTESSVNKSREALDGHNIDITVNGTITRVGEVENTFTYTVTDDYGVDVSGYYDIESVFGILRVDPMFITLTSGNSEVYFGNIAENHDVTSNPALPDGHFINPYGFESRTSIGIQENTFEYEIFDSEGNVLAKSGRVDAADCFVVFNIEYGSLTVYGPEIKEKITITSHGGEHVYDGNEFFIHESTVEGNLLNGDNAVVDEYYNSQTEIGSCENVFHYYIADINGEILQDEYTDPDFAIYDVTCIYGILSVVEGRGSDSGNLTAPMPSLEEMWDNERFRISGNYDGTFLLKNAHYGDYNGYGWDGALLGEEKYNEALAAIALQNAGADPRTVYIELIDSGYLVPYYSTAYDADRSVTNYSVTFYPGGNYAPYLTGDWAEMEYDYRSYAYFNYLNLPYETKAEMISIIDEQIDISGLDIYSLDTLSKIAWVENFVKYASPYTLGYSIPDSVDDIAVWFLSDPDAEGVCAHFATAATVMLRALDIPARYVTGFSAGVRAGETVTVTGERAHAWVEVYLDGIGWIPVDPTGPSDDLIPKENFDGANETFSPFPEPPQLEKEDIKLVFKDAVYEYSGYTYYPVDLEYYFTDVYGNPISLYDTVLNCYGDPITFPGISEIGADSVDIYNENGEDITSKYNVDLSDTGIIEVTPKYLKMDLNDQILNYIEGESYQADPSKISMWLYDRHGDAMQPEDLGIGIEFYVYSETLYGPGKTPIMLDPNVIVTDLLTGEDVSYLYDIDTSMSEADLIVCKRLYIQLKEEIFFEYTGEIYRAADYYDEIFVGIFEDPDYTKPFISDEIEIAFELSGAIRDYGTASARILKDSIQVFNVYTGENLTDQYYFHTSSTEMVIAEYIRVEIDDAATEYNGSPFIPVYGQDLDGNYINFSGRPVDINGETDRGWGYYFDEMSLELEGEGVDPGTYIVRIKSVIVRDLLTDEDVSHRFEIDLSDTAVLTINKRSLTVKSDSAIKPMDEATYVTNHKASITDGKLMSGHTITYAFTGYQSTVGKSPNEFEVIILDANGDDVTDIYDVKYTYGTLTMAYDRLVFETASASKVYDGTALKNGTALHLVGGSVRAEHDWDGSATFVSITEPGTVKNKPTIVVFDEYGNDITEYYIIDESKLGTLTVEKISLAVEAESKSARYNSQDPQTLKCENHTVLNSEVLLDGHKVEATYYGSISAPGTAESGFKSVKVRDSSGRDVTKYYDIETITGLLELTV